MVDSAPSELTEAGSTHDKGGTTMFDPFATSLSLGWILLAAGVVSTLVIATDKVSYASDVRRQAAERSRHHQDLKPAARWSLVALSLLLASYGALRIQEDHNWLPLQKPQFYAWHINTMCSSDSSKR